MIGPYATNDDRVLDYHFELMKLAKVDGIILDWYGEVGSNGDIDQTGFQVEFNSPKIPIVPNSSYFERPDSPTLDDLHHGKDACDRHGMKFIIKMEDRFARSEQLESDVEHNVRYIRNRSLPHTNIKLKKLKLPYGRYLLNFLKSTIKQYF